MVGVWGGRRPARDRLSHAWGRKRDPPEGADAAPPLDHPPLPNRVEPRCTRLRHYRTAPSHPLQVEPLYKIEALPYRVHDFDLIEKMPELIKVGVNLGLMVWTSRYEP